MADDPKISQRYRELPREEPPRHIDEAILAAARRAAETRPAPLVVPSGRRHWYFPLAAAAIIVLAVAVTVHVERQHEDLEIAEAPAAAPAAKRELFTPDPKPAPAQEQRAQRDAEAPQALQKAQKAPSPPSAPAAAASPASPAQDAVSGVRESEQPRAALRSRVEPTIGAAANFSAASPEQWLQGIADLRRQGRHEEADTQLAEFRRRYPDYRIPEGMLDSVKRK